MVTMQVNGLFPGGGFGNKQKVRVRGQNGRNPFSDDIVIVNR
jgi:hypothetical protein